MHRTLIRRLPSSGKVNNQLGYPDNEEKRPARQTCVYLLLLPPYTSLSFSLMFVCFKNLLLAVDYIVNLEDELRKYVELYQLEAGSNPESSLEDHERER